MNPIAIRAQNLRTFGTLDVDLPTGCVVIAGANGAGKSTILNAIDIALFAGRGELPGLLSLGEDELVLELEFEHAGELYRVRRMYSGKGRGKTTLDLEHCAWATEDDGVSVATDWEPLTRETAAATQQHLEQILGLSRTTFRASAFLAQGDGAAFCEADPSEAKAILVEILGLDIYDRFFKLAHGELRTAEDDLVRLRARRDPLEQHAGTLPEVRSQLTKAGADLAAARDLHLAAEGALESAQQAHAGNAAAAERVRAAEAAAAAAKSERERARVAYAAAVQAGVDRERRQAELDEAAEVAATVPQLEERLAAVRQQARLAEQREQLQREADRRSNAVERVAREALQLREHAAELVGKADHIDAHIGEAGDCDRCGQTLGADAAARAAASYRAEATDTILKASGVAEAAAGELAAIAELRERAPAIVVADTTEDPGWLEQQLTVARAAVARGATLAEQVRHLAEQAGGEDQLTLALAATNDTVTACDRTLAEAQAVVADDEQLRQTVELARATVVRTAASVNEHRETLVRLEVAEQHAAAAAAELETLHSDMQKVNERVDVLRLAERAFGRDGIPALIVENAAIPQLEVEANRILGELGGNTAGCRVELRTQRAKKDGDLKETLDIVIITPDGERPYKTFSGGERTRLNLSLRIALARLLAHRRGAESRLLAIDEPDGLDQAGMHNLANVLRGVGDDFERILLVSHHPDFATEFEQSIVVANDGDRSRVAVETLAPVAA